MFTALILLVFAAGIVWLALRARKEVAASYVAKAIGRAAAASFAGGVAYILYILFFHRPDGVRDSELIPFMMGTSLITFVSAFPVVLGFMLILFAASATSLSRMAPALATRRGILGLGMIGAGVGALIAVGFGGERLLPAGIIYGFCAGAIWAWRPQLRAL